MKPKTTERQELENHIRAMNPGDLLVYEDIAAIAQRGWFQSMFYSVQKQLEKEGIILENVRGVGYRRLSRGTDSLRRAENYWLPKSSRCLGRAINTVSAVKVTEVPKEQQTKVLAMSALVHAAQSMLGTEQIKRHSAQYDGIKPSDLGGLIAAGFTG